MIDYKKILEDLIDNLNNEMEDDGRKHSVYSLCADINEIVHQAERNLLKAEIDDVFGSKLDYIKELSTIEEAESYVNTYFVFNKGIYTFMTQLDYVSGATELFNNYFDNMHFIFNYLYNEVKTRINYVKEKESIQEEYDPTKKDEEND